MLLRIFAVGAVLAGIMIAAHDHRLLARVHVVGSCTTLSTAADGSQLRSCVAGQLSGKPDLTSEGCTEAGARAAAELWHCPAPLAANVARQ